MPEKPILIVHPNDKTTSFLRKIKNYLIEKFGKQVHHFNIYPTIESHETCLERISIHPKTGLIIFLGHGRSDKLFGAKGPLYGNIEFVSQEAIAENPSAYFYNDDFINESNIEVFSEKKIFCLSCDSNSKIAELAIDKGAKCFLGFGDIPTSKGEFEKSNEHVSSGLVMRMKTEVNHIVKTSLVLSIRKSSTFDELLNYIKFITSQEISDVLINKKNSRERHLLADHLYYLKTEAMIIGNRKLKLLE